MIKVQFKSSEHQNDLKDFQSLTQVRPGSEHFKNISVTI